MNLYLDIETTGVPDRKLNWKTDYDQFPYVVSVAWKTGKKINKFLINQEGRKMPKEVTAIHGVSTKMSNDPKLTNTAKYVFEQLCLDVNVASKIVGHNIYFDTSIIKANICRLYGPESIQLQQMDEGLDKSKRVDTMRIGQKLNGKWNKLTELYLILFGEQYANPHTAEGDIIAVEKIHKELIKLGHI